MLPLRELQTRFFAALGQPARGGDRGLLASIAPSATLDAGARLGVYRDMYRARLVEVLEEDFPATARVLGTRFGALARRYVAGHPSTHPSLRFFGARFPEFLATVRASRALPFVVDLARLEWTRLAVFDAPDPRPVTLALLRATPPADWGGLRFRVIEASATLDAGFAVHDLWARLQPVDPAAAAPRFDRRPPLPAPTTIRVWREAYTVYQASMDALEREALAVIAGGEPFGVLCDRLAERVGMDEAPARAGALLARWIDDAILELASP